MENKIIIPRRCLKKRVYRDTGNFMSAIKPTNFSIRNSLNRMQRDNNFETGGPTIRMENYFAKISKL